MFHLSSRRLLTVALAVSMSIPAAASATTTVSPFTRTVFFGDSLTDSGYFRPILMQANPSASIVGRFTTNPGLTWAEFLALRYGTNASANGNGQQGDNYAVGGARAGVDSVGALGATPSLVSQSTNYLASNAGKADAGALYTVWGGANDLFAVAGGAPAAATIGQAVTSQIGLVANLKAAGAQYIMVPNLPDIGLTPQFIAGGATMQGLATTLATNYNQALYGGLAAQGLEVIPLDTFGMMREISANPASFGFTNATAMACKSGQSITCLPTEFAAPGADKHYVFADGVHPTTRTHEILAQYAASVIEGPRQQLLVARSALSTGKARIEHVAEHLSPNAVDGTHWWGGLRMDSQRHGGADLFDGTGGTGLFGVDWVSNGMAVGMFGGYGRMDADFGLSGGDYTLAETTLGVFGNWKHDGLWLGAQLSYSWLDADINRQVNLGSAQRLHAGQADGSNLTAALNAGWEFGQGALRHGPVVGVSYQDLSLDGYAESGAGATALAFADVDMDSLVGRVGWQLRIEAEGLQPYARLTWDKEFEDEVVQGRAMLQSQSQLGFYRVPGIAFDTEYATLVAGARMSKAGLDWNIGLSATAGASGAHDASLFFNLGGSF